jgi:protein CpxP
MWKGKLMAYAIDRAARGAAALGFAALVLLPPGTGNAQGPENSPAFQLAQAQTSPTRPSPARPGAGQQQPASRDQQVEAQLKQLQQELAITDAQKAQFDAFGQVMRSNAQAMDSAMQQEQQNPPKNAVDDLKSVQHLAETQLDGLKRLVPAFQALYDSLSDQQKKKADTVFGRSQEGPQPAARKK